MTPKSIDIKVLVPKKHPQNILEMFKLVKKDDKSIPTPYKYI